MQPNPATAEDPQSVLRHACAELERRLRAGEDSHAEQFLDAHPALASNPDWAVELIRVEWLVRRSLGQAATLDMWLTRFPQWKERLARWLDQKGAPGTTDAGARTLADTREHPPDASATGQLLDDHELLDELGHGGMGVVYRAWDPTLRREVALKKIRAGVLATPDQVRRFYREARAAAQLAHPNLVGVYGMGLHRGEHCFTMPLVSGGSLEQHKGRFQNDAPAAVLLVEKVARAVQAAYQKGIIHRDLKPANILLDEHGEPLVSDFGLAKFCDAGADETLSGQMLGTPAYMAPEQAGALNGKVGPATDVWALGVILFELLTGRRPFQGQGAEDVLDQVRTTVPPRPRQLRPGLDPALEAIVVRCLSRDPRNRYPTAEPLADNLGRWRRGELRRSPASARARRAAVAVAVLLLVAVLVLPFTRRAPPAQDPPSLREALAAGQEVELVGKRGLPRGHTLRLGEASLSVGQEEDAGFTLGTWKYTLMELLADPAQTGYVVTLQMKQENTRAGEAGLYLFHSTQQTRLGREHFFLALTFADYGPAKGQLLVTAWRLTENGSRQTSRSLELRRAPEPGKWHELQAEVTPDRVRFRWDGKDIGSVLPRELQRCARFLTDPQANPVPANPPLFSPRGPLGIFVFESSVSVRNVRIKPLP